MKASDKAEKHWREQHLKNAAQQYQKIMEPHIDKMESDNGMLSLLMVSGIAQLVASGLESQAALAHTIKQASILSGIPVDALEAQARFSSAMLTCIESDQ